MAMVIVLFNLKEGVAPARYEQWARATDLPTVNALASVKQFSVLKASGLLNGDAAAYAYVELLDVHSVAALRADTQSETMRAVAREFRELADAPVFIVTEPLE